jgi:hypothetical protein
MQSAAEIFGPAFRGLSTLQSWLAFLPALFALPLTEAEAAIWRECTGRQSLLSRAFSEVWLVCGRRSGKSFVMALLGVYLASAVTASMSLEPPHPQLVVGLGIGAPVSEMTVTLSSEPR